MGGCASKPKTNGDETGAPLPVLVEEPVKPTTTTETVTTKDVEEVKVELKERKIDDQIDEKKVEEDGQQHSLGSLLNETEAKKEPIEDKKGVEVPTETKMEEKPKEEVKVEAAKEEVKVVEAAKEEVKVEATKEEVKVEAAKEVKDEAAKEEVKVEAAKSVEPPATTATPNQVAEAKGTKDEVPVATVTAAEPVAKEKH